MLSPVAPLLLCLSVTPHFLISSASFPPPSTAFTPPTNIVDISTEAVSASQRFSLLDFSGKPEKSMLPGGGRDSQLRESGGQKVHPQPAEETMNQSPEALEALIARIFTNISSLKSAYIQLQSAHTPYSPDKIQSADRLVISQLKTLSELKHLYREHNPRPALAPLQDPHLSAEIQEQQSLLRTYEIMVMKFQSEIQNKDSEISHRHNQIRDAKQRGERLEKNLALRGLSSRAGSRSFPDGGGFFSVDLTPELFTSTVGSASDSIHDFSKPLINMMKAAGWDLDAAADSIEPDVTYVKRAHKKHAFESHICRKMFDGFQEEGFSVEAEGDGLTKESFFRQYLSLRRMDPTDSLGQNPDSVFGKFCRGKYMEMVHPKMEASFFGNLDQRSFVAGGGHPRTPFYSAFVKLAKAVWILHRLAYSFEPSVRVFQVKKGSSFSEAHMESMVKDVDGGVVGLMVMPGFRIEDRVVRARVYLMGGSL